MVRREHDPVLINRIANAAEVRPFIDHVGADGDIDLSPTVGFATQTGVLWYSNGRDAVVAFEQAADRVWNAHIMFAATCRGNRALDTAQAFIEQIRPYADELWGLIPLANKAARWFARRLGFSHVEFEDRAPMGRCEALVWRAC